MTKLQFDREFANLLREIQLQLPMIGAVIGPECFRVIAAPPWSSE